MRVREKGRSQVGIDLDPFVECVAEAKAFLQRQPSQAAKGQAATLDIDDLHRRLADLTQRSLSEPELLDELAQAMACGHIALHQAAGAADRLVQTASPLIATALAAAAAGWATSGRADEPVPPPVDASQLARLYEPFLDRFHRRRRSRHGVYYTPAELARFIVRQIDHMLRIEFQFADGLADTITWSEVISRNPHLHCPPQPGRDEPFVRILDPAVGGGVFLVAVIESIHATLVAKWQAAAWTARQQAAAWQEYVAASLLPRLCGLELMLPAAVVAHWQVLQTLTKTGYVFQGDEQIRILLVDTLRDWPTSSTPATPEANGDSAHYACRQEPFTVVLGNPPFSGVSGNKGEWITGLLRGRNEDGSETSSYFRANNKPLSERKHWLQDDYVKFLRFAHWRIETSGAGVVGFVTNHGYLDNVTFRGLREQLRKSFSRLTVFDLHGNTKKKERPPEGQTDENLFGIESGIAIGLLRKPPGPAEARIEYGELWGTQEAKLTALAGSNPEVRRIDPAAPYHFFTPGRGVASREYETGWVLTEAMPVNSTVAVTARDSFVIAFTRDELVQRLQVFRDLTISDEEIRARFFSNSRSTRYPPGDTRGWKLAAARQRMAADSQFARHIRPCLYRPFDRRWIYWADWMVDWPRNDVNRHLIAADNLALIARRQMLPTHPCNFFWVSRDIPIDGVIRSDNRGSESAFPLFLADDPPGDGGHAVANFHPALIAEVAAATGLTWQSGKTPASPHTFGALELFQVIYAQFFSTSYRQRYADWLRIEFPRVFVPRSANLFHGLSRLGGELAAAHAALEPQLPVSEGRGDCQSSDSPPPATVNAIIQPGFPKFAGHQLLLNPDVPVPGVTRDVWEFQVGGHQVCRKWWKDRRGRVMRDEDRQAYRVLVQRVRRTIDLVGQLDRLLASQGDWPAAFLPHRLSTECHAKHDLRK